VSPTCSSKLAIKLAAVAACLGSGVACVDSTRFNGPTCNVPAPVPYSGDVVIPSTDTSPPGPYLWKNVVIKGGGFVSGIIMSPVLPGLVFARTDVGGAYRYDPTAHRWMAITDWVGHTDSNLLGIESIAADPVDPSRVYLAAGMYLTGSPVSILSSTDMGQTWARNDISAPMGGNADGRSMGERLAIDPNLTSILYFGSRNTGLWTSTDFAQTWTKVSGFPTTSTGTEYGLTFVVFDPRSGSPGSPTPAIYVGVQGDTGTGLYRTTDAGVTWEAVAGQPSGQPAGLTPHHAVPDRCGNLYLAYNNGPGPNNITSGAVWRYSMTSGDWANMMGLTSGYGFGGIAADAAHPGTFIVTTIDRGADEIYRSTNGGQSIPTWVPIGSAATRDVAGAAWVLGHPPKLGTPGWMGDVEIDPFDPAHALYITGGGIWSSDDVTDADKGVSTHWTFDDDGLEETVVSDLVSPPTGAPLLSAVGDISGFRHDDLDVSPPGGMFDGFVNTMSLDFAEAAPDIVVRVGSSSGGGSYSTDGGTTWTPFATAPAASKGSGSIAVSADGATFLWAPQVLRGATPLPSLSRDRGATWTACVGPAAGAPAPGAQVAADRVNPSKFYASDGTGMYVSTDGGATFVKAAAIPSGRPRPVFGIEGDVWVATNSGLFHSQDSAATFTRVGGPDSSPYQQVGFGMAAPGQSYPAVYLAGSVAGVWGTYRSDDVGATWQRIDDPQHQFGWMHCLTGDPRLYGRVYLGTGGRGIIYGDQR
jgi:photosystem II stability/assembly factor-like uncharacterized protein